MAPFKISAGPLSTHYDMAEKLNDEQCAFKGCYTVDFLPITCNLCSNHFCTVHATTENHNCPSESALISGSTQSPLDNTRIPCSFSGCNVPTLFYVNGDKPSQSCPDCGGVFCLTHRHAAQHNCKVATPSGSSSSKSQVLAQKAIENSKSLSSAKSGSRNKVMTPKMKAVELMKMRRKAEAANPRDVSANITMDQRFFAVVTDGSVEKTLWIPNDVVAGKALDLFASKLGVLGSPLTLRSVGGEPLQMGLPLSSQVDSPANLVIERLAE